MLEQLRQTCRQLLDVGRAKVVIGYGRPTADGPAVPVFIERSEDVGQLVFDDGCLANLAVYLSQKEIRALGRPAIVVKGCDERALVVLEKESQIDRSEVVVIGVACDGVGQPRQTKCKSCDVRVPRFADVVIEVTGPPLPPGEGRGEGEVRVERPLAAPPHPNPLPEGEGTIPGRYADLDALLALSPAERMAFWQEEFSRCVKCYACRQVCPMCYCNRCIVDKNRPQVIATSPTLVGNFAWHITRAFHLAGRCVGCDECTRVCPAGIDLRLLNLSLARAAEEHFAFRAGMDREAEPIVGAYSERDKEEFIR